MAAASTPEPAATAEYQDDNGAKAHSSDSLTRTRVAEEGLINVAGSFGCTAAAAAIAWGIVDVLTLVGWALFIQVVNLGGCLLLLRFRRDPPQMWRWRAALIVYSMANGIGWGIAAYLLIDPAFPIMELLLIAVVIAAATCWQWSFLSSWLALVLFDVFAFGGMAVRLLDMGDPFSIGLATVVILVGVALLLLAYGFGRHLLGMEILALHDPLTGLPNRSLFQDRLQVATAVSKRSNVLTAVLLLDLDHFKHINDGLGHDVGDKLLQDVSARLNACVRAMDTVARLGGDEFVVIQTNIRDPGQAVTLAQRIAIAIGKPFRIDQHDIYTGATVGITLYPTDTNSIDQILKNADLALYRAKARERGTVEFYSDDLGDEAEQRMNLAAGLRQALADRKLYFHYQPKYDATDNRLVGAEALLRWHSPDYGEVSPGVFIGIAESTGLILGIGNFVLERICEQLREWREANLTLVPISINLSAAQFRNANLLSQVRESLETERIDPQYLELEVTETALMQDYATAASVIAGLTEIGVALSIDDFGTGYSSLAYLKQFPVNRLKIDRSFVTGIGSNEKDAAIARAITNLGHSLGLKVLAEGVEDDAQMAKLREIGADEVQGFLMSRPLDTEAFEALLQPEPVKSGAELT